MTKDNDMKNSDKRTFDAILKHKEYFDQKLVAFVFDAQSKIASLRKEIEDYKKQNSQLSLEVSSLKRKIEFKDKEIYRIRKFSESKSKEIDEIKEYLKELEEKLKIERKEYEEQSKRIEELIKENNELNERVRRKLKKMQSSNSTNSNMPSSFDVLSHTKAKANANTRVKSSLKRGGQKGHEAHRSVLNENPDEVIMIEVRKVPSGAVKRKDDDGCVYYATQEIDLVFKTKVIETRYYINENGIELNDEILKKYAINSIVYTPHFKSCTIYLNQKGTIPLQRLCDITNEMSKGSINLQPSTIVSWNKEFHKKSEQAREEILASILESEITHVDETGMPVNSSMKWMHTITNDRGSYITVTNKRSDTENGPIKALTEYEGILVHDHFKAYYRLMKCKHAECNAHIDRYLQSGIDIDDNEECKEMLSLMHEMLRRKIELIENEKLQMDDEEIQRFEKRFLAIAKKGIENYYQNHPKCGKKYEPDFIPTFKRMIEYKDEHLRFIKDFRVPYTNNAAERQCRAIKSKKKASGQFVSFTGAEAYADVLTVMQTSKLRHENTLANIESIFS